MILTDNIDDKPTFLYLNLVKLAIKVSCCKNKSAHLGFYKLVTDSSLITKKMIKWCTNELCPCYEMLFKLIKFGNIDYTFINKSVV